MHSQTIAGIHSSFNTRGVAVEALRTFIPEQKINILLEMYAYCNKSTNYEIEPSSSPNDFLHSMLICSSDSKTKDEDEKVVKRRARICDPGEKPCVLWKYPT